MAFSLAWFSLGVTVYISHNQSKIRDELEQEKIKRRHRAIVRLYESIFSLERDLGMYDEKFDPDYYPMTKEEVNELKETIQLYYPDLSAKEIKEADEIMRETKSWLVHPIYERDLTIAQRISLIPMPYEDILKKIEQLENLLKETISDLDKSIVKKF